jgi:hypothetical protein
VIGGSGAGDVAIQSVEIWDPNGSAAQAARPAS